MIFGDEKKFNLDGPDGCPSYWRDLRKEPRHFSTRNVGGGSGMIWGAFSSVVLAKLTTSSNVSFTFQLDNATIHATRSTETCLKINKVNTMDWPSNTPDLNPMENLW
uniref:DDE_3 domain-containing protein n=1 Tax=Heterorhabditis bacteriophora TaxID=37862 RepID=A0A1I7X420_HETBA